jgi:hypothetical protein
MWQTLNPVEKLLAIALLIGILYALARSVIEFSEKQ